jgi:hypothetical protein
MLYAAVIQATCLCAFRGSKVTLAFGLESTCSIDQSTYYTTKGHCRYIVPGVPRKEGRRSSLTRIPPYNSSNIAIM